jgi:hypothetical protein
MPDAFYTNSTAGGRDIQEVRLRDSSGAIFDPSVIPTQPDIVTNVALAIGATSNPVSGIRGVSYFVSADGVFTATAELYLEYLGRNGTWFSAQTPAGVAVKWTSAGGPIGVVIGDNATLRVRDAVAAISALTVSLS